jgi:hypothetical protein
MNKLEQEYDYDEDPNYGMELLEQEQRTDLYLALKENYAKFPSPDLMNSLKTIKNTIEAEYGINFLFSIDPEEALFHQADSMPQN